MKLSRVEVKNLFGVFNHNININNERGITIIIGENGLGKTVILEMIMNFFNKNFYYFNSVTFDELIFEFEDEVIWTVKKEIDDEQSENLLVLLGDNHSESKFLIQSTNLDPQYFMKHATQIGRILGYIRRPTPNRWEDTRSGIIYTAKGLVEKYGNEVPLNYKIGSEIIDAPDWFASRFDKINVTIIETQRIFVLDEHEINPVDTVRKYSNEISERIKSKLAESTDLSSKLDRTYPNRLVSQLKQRENSITDEELNKRLNQLEEKRELMDKVGLIETEKDSNLLKINNPDAVVKDVLMLYIEDSFDKLSIFNDMSEKIALLLRIINSRFKHKKLFTNKEKGFLLKSTVIQNELGTYQDIPIEKLSSGEKNELILFYRLIFNTKENSLILIDEPEISLHISWQNQFMSDLNEIHKLNKLDILIATHSPDIISNNWDLRVELKGVE
ncbi:AAA family ATPase [Paenibacillus monticola]|uniref:AAA family ATPase n=1 Tax=Paenibacillus monticola TaxID=2666075 RepID=A0A7X2H8P0_9BACL|nr:AAA family ATPase [Paenibacillus monticola]MRN55589.1 AAA family ATPase [Paenibacillus monticola]